MSNITNCELYTLKDLILSHNTFYQKLINFADYAVDPQFKQTFNKAAQNTLSSNEKLISFLN